ncbi:hypothetical protein [Vibrio anguillarum]|nr:hypothetical protein [Vibrio anguillarum]AZS26252.1 hypothetical protein DYL72_15195 [Vibrio anguillarum]
MFDFNDQMKNLEALNENIAIKQGCQKYPHSKIKVGAVLFKVDVSEWDDGSTSISIDEWIVRSIKRKRGTQTPIGKSCTGYEYGDTAPLYVNVTAKIKDVTWVRQSRKVNDFGWSKSIPQYYKKQFQVGERLPNGIFTTPLAALKSALKDNERMLARYIDYRNRETDETEIAEFDEDITHKTKSVRLLKSRIKALTKK